jgi:hypothetical protein
VNSSKFVYIPQHFLKYASIEPQYGQKVISLENACRAANEELERRLGPVVYGLSTKTVNDGTCSAWGSKRQDEDTHRAQLLDITKIEGEKNE